MDLLLPPPSADTMAEVIANRRQLHAQPELSEHEVLTSQFLTARLRSLGLQVQRCPSPTGALASLDTGRPGRQVMLRADIDALPIQEDSGEPFSSTQDGRMHACGHDGHAAILLGVARTLRENSDRLGGSYLFCFQPAEEVIAGAKAMLAGGLLEEWHPDAVIGLHLAAWLESGEISTRAGLLWSGCDLFDLVIEGPGGHGGMMKRAGNVVSAQAFVVERLFSLLEGLEYEGVSAHCTVGQVRTDGTYNVVPQRALVRGTLRTFTPEMRAELIQRLRDLLLEADGEFQVSSRLELSRSTIPCVNDPEVTAAVLQAGRDLAGGGVQEMERPLTVSDDMAEFLSRISGCYFMVGAKPLDCQTPPAHHSPHFRIDEGSFEIAIRMLAESAARLAAH